MMFRECVIIAGSYVYRTIGSLENKGEKEAFSK